MPPTPPTVVRRVALALIVSLCAPTAAARAQPAACNPTDAELEESQALFIAGAAAVDAGRWADAIESFERAYALSCRVAALYNLAMALRALGRHREARDTFDRLVRDHDDIPGDLRQTVANFRREEANRVAVLELAGVEPSVSPEVSFDGRAVTDVSERPIRIETDAGAHSLVARIPEHQPFVWEGELSDGQREQVNVRFEPIVVAEGLDPFVIIGPILAAVAIGVGIGLGIYLYDEAQLDPLSRNRCISAVGGSSC